MCRKKISAEEEFKNILQNILFEPLIIFNPPIWEDSDSFCTDLETYTSFGRGRVNVDMLLVFAADSIKVSKSFQSWTSFFLSLLPIASLIALGLTNLCPFTRYYKSILLGSPSRFAISHNSDLSRNSDVFGNVSKV